MNANLVADTFTLASTTQISSIQFWALQDDITSYTGSIFWAIYTNAAGVPGTSVASGTVSPAGVSTGLTAFGENEFSYTFSASASLGAGTYFLAIHNGPTSSTPSTNMFWENSNANSGNSQTMDLSSPGQPWVANFSSLAFSVSAVPEPGSSILTASGLLGAFLIRRRNSRNEA